MYFLLMLWECISYHIMQCAANTPTVAVRIIMQCAANTPTFAVGIISWLRRWSDLFALYYCRFSTTQILQQTVKNKFVPLLTLLVCLSRASGTRDATAVDPASAASSSVESFAAGVSASASSRSWPPE